MESNFILNPGFFGANLYIVSDQIKSDLKVNGSNQKHLMIVYREDQSPLDETFLTKILGAVNYDLQQDTVLIGLKEDQHFSFQKVSKTWTPKHMISLGVTPTALGLNMVHQLYQPVSIENCSFLFANNLSEIAADKNKKGALWGCLQTLFINPENKANNE